MRYFAAAIALHVVPVVWLSGDRAQRARPRSSPTGAHPPRQLEVPMTVELIEMPDTRMPTEFEVRSGPRLPQRRTRPNSTALTRVESAPRMQAHDPESLLNPEPLPDPIPTPGQPADLGLHRPIAIPSPTRLDPLAPLTAPEVSLGSFRPIDSGPSPHHPVERPGYHYRIEDDGHMTFRDKPSVEAKLPCVQCTLTAAKEALNLWWKDPYGYNGAGHLVGRANPEPPLDPEMDLRMPIAQSVTPVLQKRVAMAPGSLEPDTKMLFVPLVTGRLDLTEVAMRALGQDPYQADKLKHLESTRKMREELARTHRRASLNSAVAAVPQRLRAIWGNRQWSAATRRRLLFELWDECDEDPGSAGHKVRVMIGAFIRRTLPPPSGYGYSAEELRTLNAGRTSHAEFRPYEDVSDQTTN